MRKQPANQLSADEVAKDIYAKVADLNEAMQAAAQREIKVEITVYDRDQNNVMGMHPSTYLIAEVLARL